MPITLKTMSMKYRERPSDDWSPAMVQAVAPLDPVKEMIGIVVDGKRPSQAVSAGQYVIVKNSTITGITDGLYTAKNALSTSADVSASDLNAEITNGVANDLKNSIAFRKLWENSSPTTSFASQPITLSDSNYDFLISVYGNYAGQPMSSLVAPKGMVGRASASGWVANAFTTYNRTYTVDSDTSITFTDATRNGATNNTDMIPICIYGVKLG